MIPMDNPNPRLYGPPNLLFCAGVSLPIAGEALRQLRPCKAVAQLEAESSHLLLPSLPRVPYRSVIQAIPDPHPDR